MAWPEEPLPTQVVLDVEGTATDITSYLRSPQGTSRTIVRGRSDEQTAPSPTRVEGLVLDNNDLRFSPRVPSSPWYGQIGRGSALTIGLQGASTRLHLPGTKGDVIDTPDSATTSITGDIEVRVDAHVVLYRPTSSYWVSKWVSSGDQRSWLVRAQSTGTLRWYWTADGVTQLSATSTVPPETSTGRLAIAVTHDVDNGAGGNTVRFWTAPSMAGPWSELGDPVVTAGTTSLYDSTAPTEIGGASQLLSPDSLGILYGWEIWSGIAAAGGTLVSGMDLSGQTPGAGTVSDGTRTWTLQGGTSLVDVDSRVAVEMASLAPRWDSTGRDATVLPDVAGVLRRLGTAGSSLRSSLYRSITGGQDPDAYWPCEDGTDATSLASSISGIDPMQITGAPALASDSSVSGSEALPVLKDAQLTGRLPSPYSATGQCAVQWVLHVDTTTVSPPSGQTIMSAYLTGGTVGRWELSYRTAGGLRLLIYDTTGAIVEDSGNVSFALDDRHEFVQVRLVDNGADIDWRVSVIFAGETTAFYTAGTLVGHSTGGVRVVRANEGGGLIDVTVGHVYTRSADVTTEHDLGMSVGGWAGETAGERIIRLCDEEDLLADVRGDPGSTPVMGPQPRSNLLGALVECETADGGLLYEPRQWVGIGYRTLRSMLDQDPVVSLSYAGHQLVAPFEPEADDQRARNDVTVRRTSGSMIRVVDGTGPMGTADPPAGIGVYAEDLEVNVQEDAQLADIAGWRLRQGTLQESRVPQLTVNLGTPEVLADAVVSDGVAEVDVGDIVEITSPPEALSPDPVRVRVTGVKEKLSQYVHAVEVAGGPASGLDTMIWQPDVTFGDNFESGGTAAWPTVTGAVSVVAAAARAGSYGLRLSPGGGSAAAVATSTTKWDQDMVWGQVVLRFRLGTLTASGTSMDLVTLRNTAGTGHLDFFVHSTARTFWVDLVGGSSELDTGVTADTGVWHDLQLRVFYGHTQWWAWIQLDGVEYGPITQATATPSFVRSFHLGTTSTTKTYEVDVDSVAIVVGDQEPDSWWEVCSRWDTSAATLTAGATAAATTLQVTTPAGDPLWTTSEEDLPFDVGVGGERIRVEAVTGATSPQTMTVVRAVNGVVKAHATGATVGLWKPSYYAIS
jgi:hypothetical protein